ncbi:MAG TPA: ammonia-forming cytochrome c nitrite reductase subunit c552 [Syntrophomonadaceae bacterium]|nr:ammonia-forming cytochrome c nitrite reductase subunit c552 [Syntrophomonadaceae bacterium]
MAKDTTGSSTDRITEEWAQSLHSRANPSTIGRDECIRCHDGVAFAQNISQSAQLASPIGQDCFSCHAGYGRELKEVGVLDVPTKDVFNAGLGAVCSSCHNANDVPDISNPRRAYPHYSSQADVLTGFGGIRENEEIQFNNTYGHISLANSCVDCHMPTNKSAYISHEFKMQAEFAELVCAACHQGATDFNFLAKADYDGNGKIEGIQDEVVGLMDILEGAIIDELEGGSFAASKGSINYYDKKGNIINSVPDEVYLASYNYLLIEYDGSLGVHNPLFTVQILQYSYKQLTGEDIPNASLVR